MKKLMFRILPIIVLIIVALLGVSYAMFSSSFELGQSGLTTGTIDVNFTENKNTLKLERAVPEYDSEGKVSDNYLDFTVDAKVTGDFVVPYVVTAEKDSTLSNIDDKYIKLYLERSTDGINYQTVMEPKTFEEVSESTTGVKLGSMIIDTGNLTKTTKYYYRLRMWLDGSYNNSSSSNTFVLTTNAYLTTEQENVDTTKPICTFSNPSISVANTSEIELTCTDDTMGINETVLNLNDIEINNDNLELLSISNPEKIANGYKYKISVKGLSTGTTNISLASGKVSDKLGNQIDNVSKELTIKGFTYNVIYIKDSNIKSLEKDSDSCTTTGSNTSCSITLPTVEVEEGYKFLGYYDNDTKINTNTIEISEDKTINIKSESDSYTVEYDYIENGGDSISENTEEDVTTSASTTKVAAESIDTSKIATKSAYNLKTANNKKSLFKSVAYNKNIDLTPKAERKGYEFVGWNTDKDAKNGLKALKMSRGNIVLYAIYKKIVKTSFEVQDPEAVTIESKDVVCTMYNKDSDCSIKSPSLTAKTGYTALGWNTSSDATTSELNGNITTKVTDNSKYYSITKNNTKYTATFTIQDSYAASKSGGTTTCYKYNGSKSCRVTAPKLTAKSGYKIAGWNKTKDSEESEADSESYIDITENTTFYSVTSKTLTASFKVQNSMAAIASSTSESCDLYNGNTEGCEIDVPSLIANEGYTAIGWNTDKSKKENSLDSNKIYIKKNTTYYSITRNNAPYTATFVFQDENAATMSGGTTSCYRYNNETKCSITAPTLEAKEGYDVIGWGTYSSSTSSSLKSNGTTTITSDKNYYSVTRESKEYHATFILQDENAVTQSGGTITCYKYNGSSTCNITSPKLVAKNGYYIVGWNTNSNETTSELAPSSTVKITDDVTYYSITKDKLTARYVLQDSKAAAIKFNISDCYRYNGEESCKASIPTLTANSGYTVIGWNTNSNATTSNIDAIDKMSITENMTIYSITKNNTPYTANWDGNGSTLSDTNESSCYVYNGESGCIVIPPIITPPSNTPQIIGFSLRANLCENNENYNKVTNSLAILKATNEKTWYAQTYNSTPLKATFNIGDNVDSVDAASAECYRRNGSNSCSVTLPSITPKTGYDAAWYKQANLVTIGDMNTDTTFTAKGYAHKYEIKYNLNSGECVNCDSNYTIENSTTLKTPTRAGFIFTGWTGSNGTTPEMTVNIAKGSTGVKEYTANWKTTIVMISGNKNTIGSIAQIGDKQFYVIGQGTGNESGKTKLLLKTSLGNSTFSASKYWSSTYGNEVRYDTMPYVYDSNSNLYKIINNYVNKVMSESGVNNITGRLMSYDEARSLPEYILLPEYKREYRKDSYWIGSAYSGTMIWFVTISGSISMESPLYEKYAVRPIIFVPSSVFN